MKPAPDHFRNVAFVNFFWLARLAYFIPFFVRRLLFSVESVW